MNKILNWLLLAVEINTLIRSIKIAVVVGTLLMFINHSSVIMSGEIEGHHMLKILLTYLVPYLVSTYSSVESKLNN